MYKFNLLLNNISLNKKTIKYQLENRNNTGRVT